MGPLVSILTPVFPAGFAPPTKPRGCHSGSIGLVFGQMWRYLAFADATTVLAIALYHLNTRPKSTDRTLWLILLNDGTVALVSVALPSMTSGRMIQPK